jgi:putative tryptophan/tyrosine transport system substrate-binding protein
MRLAAPSLALLVCLAQCWWIEATPAEQPQAARRIAVLLVGFSAQSGEAEALREGLRDAGYAEGRDIALAWYAAEGDYARVPALVAEILRTAPDVVVVDSAVGVGAMKRATGTIPIVIAVAADPGRSGRVWSAVSRTRARTSPAYR